MIRSDCCGCMACKVICPVGAIISKVNDKGFVEPYIQTEKCIKCDNCRVICPMNMDMDSVMQKVYAAKADNEDIRCQSQSGGVFSVLAEQMINTGGNVYGVMLDQDLKPIYSKAATTLQLQALKGSKYMQVVPGQEYMWVKKDLCEGRKVLFSGTPCCVAGLKRYLKLNGVNTDLLVTCDLICHGVVGAGMFQKYIDVLETHFSKKILKYVFRDKSVGGSESYYMKGKRMCSTNWGKFYYSDLALRESCYQCPFSSSKRVGDLTVGDYIGIEKIAPDFDDKKGISLLIVNSRKGEALFNDVKGKIVLLETGLNDCMQNNLHTPTAKPQEYEDFWKCYMENGFEYAAKEYCGFDLTKDWEVLEKKQYIRRLRYKIEQKYKRMLRRKI